MNTMNKEETISLNENVDTEKRGRIVLFSLLITLSMFFLRIFQDWNTSDSWITYIVAAGYLLLTFLGLIWVFGFQVRIKSIPCLMESSLFVASEFLFIEMFFFEDLDRIYEGVLLLGILGLIWISTYVSFLMANIFNVGLYKDIPLEQVARTASYILSIFMVYFLTFSYLANGMKSYILLPSILLSYFAVVAMHVRNLELERREFFRKSILSSLIMFILFLGVFLLGNRHEYISIVPTFGFFMVVGELSENHSEKVVKRKLWVYGFVLLVLIVLNIWKNL